MKRFRACRLSFPLLGACGLLLLTFLSLTPRSARASIESAQRAADRGEMLAAWERARASGSHRFSADVIQRTIPRATVSNVGRQSREDAYHVKGVASLPDQRLEFSLWSEGGSLANGQGSVEVRVKGDQALIRQGTGAWQEVEDFSGLFAPGGDLLAYLSAAQDVVKEGRETRAGLSFTRYTFRLDGRRFAAHMRDQLERQLAEQGDLPPGAHLELPRTYAEMAGQGELWVSEDGLPLRQILDLQFPETDEERVKARVDITFSDFGEGAPAASWVRQTLRLSSHALSQTGVLALVLLSLAGMIACWRSKKLYAAVVVTVVLSLVVTPQLQSARVAAFAGRQASSVQEEKEDRPVNQMQVSRTRTEDALGSQAPVGADLERLWGTGQLPRTSQAFWAGSTPDRQVEDSGSDSDGDGLTDAQEQLLGTSSATTDWDRDGRPDGWDTDNDRITDTLEAQGFTDANGAKWYSDPLVADSNGDGLDDGVEWFSNLTDGVPGDADGDQVPDLYDRDNDGDGVPDDVDLSPYQATLSTAPFSRSDPFALKIEGLVVGRPTYVEFQLRPVVTDHLWYAYNVLDWPLDKQGQMQDQDGTTFAQVRAAENQSVSATAGSAKQDENGDLELVPMLEIVISGAHDNLPPASTLERLYGIFVQDRVADGTEKAVYVPLQLVTETGGGARVAFRGKMLYQPDAAWDAQEVRLVWAVQALVDVCAKYGDSGICSVYSETNRTQIIQVYYDDWYLTGLDVRENQSYEIGVILEDPAVDDDVDVDDTLTLLTYALDDTFVNGRVGDDGARDLAVDELRRRFDHTLNGDLDRTATITERWGLPNTLRVYAARYTHPDQGVADLATLTDTLPATQPILNAHFTPLVERGQHVTPTLLYVSEEQFRAANLDDAGPGGGWHGDGNRQLTIDVSQGSNLTVARQRWQPYCHEGDSWVTCDVADYWVELGRRHRSLFLDEPDPAVAELERVLLQSYYLTLLMGQSGVVGLDGLPVSLLAPAERQLDAALTERLASLQALGDVRETMIKEIMVHAANTGFGVGSHLLTGGKGLSLQRGLLIMGAEMGALLIGTFLYGFGIDSQALQVTEASLEVTAKVLDKVPEIIELARSLHKIEKVISKGGQGSLKAARLAKTFSKSLKSAAPGFVFELVVIAGFLASQIATTWSGLNHIQRHLMIAETLAEIVIAVLLFILSATVVGAIVAAVIEVIMAVVELLLLIFGESQYSPTNLLTKLLYGYSLIAEPGVDIGRTGMRPDAADPLSGAGMVAGSRLRFTATVTSSATMADPTDWRAVPYIGFWNKNRLRSSTVKTELTSPGPLPDPIPASPGEMAPVWGEPFRDHTYGLVYMYRTETTRTHAVPVPLTAPGLNASLPIYLNVGYAVPYVSCWTPLIPIPICYPDELSGDLSPENIGQSIVVDVLPATLDGFYALHDTGGGYRLAWDARFPALRDADGDGLLAVAYGGNDPNDARWDADGDGLPDGYELARRETGGRAASSSPLDDDTDGDGLCDDQEVRLGTYPNQRDSDGDGLADNIEVFHQDRCDGNGNGDRAEWLGGWSFSVVPPEGAAIAAGSVLTTHVTSDPMMADTDGDGLNDRAEYTLGTHPRAPTPSPVALIAEVDDADRVVVPGQSLAYTVTVRNEVRSDVSLYFTGGLAVALPAGLAIRSSARPSTWRWARPTRWPARSR